MGPTTPQSDQPGRSFELKALIVGFLFLSLLGWLRLSEALRLWDVLGEIGIQPPPWYFAASGAVWGAVALSAAATLFLRLPWSGWYAGGAALFFAAWYWLDRLFLSRPVSEQHDLSFYIILTLVCLGWVGGTLAFPRQRRLLGK